MGDLIASINSETGKKVEHRLLTKEIFFNTAEGDGTIGKHQSSYISSNGAKDMEFKIPFDFTNLEELVLVCVPENTDAVTDVDISSDYCKKDEAYNAHSESNTSITFNYVEGKMNEFDITSVFSSIEAGDYCGLRWDQNGAGGNEIIGIRLKYN